MSTPQTPERQLARLRQRIDRIDDRIVALLNARTKVALAIGAHKAEAALPVRSPTRERALLRRLEAANPGPLGNRNLRRIYQQIMNAAATLETAAVRHTRRGAKRRHGDR